MAGKDTSTLCLFDVDGTLTVRLKSPVPYPYCYRLHLCGVSLWAFHSVPKMSFAQVARKVITQEMKDVIKSLREKVTVRRPLPRGPHPLLNPRDARKRFRCICSRHCA